MYENAIPEHMAKCPRSIPTKTPANYNPPFPGYIARYSPDMKNVAIAVIGFQFSSSPRDTTPDLSNCNAYKTARNFVTAELKGDSRPKYWEAASNQDGQGTWNVVLISYWRDRTEFDSWKEESGFDAWWKNLPTTLKATEKTSSEPDGYFLEFLNPTMDRLETVFSNNASPEGAAHMQESISQPMLQHAYWGSMRDRLAVAQDDTIEKDPKDSGAAQIRTGDSKYDVVRVQPRQNLAVIRSGQDWSSTLPDERKLYTETMHPVLIKGMDFLRDEGSEVGCFDTRFMEVVDPETGVGGKDLTFGLCYFDELASLEKWSKSHPTHMAIFGGFLKYAKQLEFNLSLKLWHEVMVLEKDQQIFEYINCTPQTGMLRAQ